MIEILNVLDLQQQKAEAELANLTRKSSQYCLEISSINEGIYNKNENSENLHMQQKWRDNQVLKISEIKGKIKSLQAQIQVSKQKYKQVLAKNIAAQDMASREQKIQMMLDEEQETSHALDTFLLSNTA